MQLIKTHHEKPTLFLSLASEGMGHATRARTLIQHLGHVYDLHVFCGGKVYRYLKDFHHQVHEIPYVKLSYRNNRMSLWATVRSGSTQSGLLFASYFSDGAINPAFEAGRPHF